MNKEDMIKIGIVAFVVIILIVGVVIVTRKKDNYEYPTGKLYVQPSGAPGERVTGSGGVDITPSAFSALVADPNGNISSTTAILPIGAIIMWGGSTMPTGWGLCNGAVYGNITSPDLTGRFVVGSGKSITAPLTPYATQYGIGDMGGEEFHQLTIPEMPSHAHTTQYGDNGDGNNHIAFGAANPLTTYGTSATGGDSANGNATLPHNNMPPYYALAYIIKYM